MQCVMDDPVVAADGHTYDRAYIQQVFTSGSRKSPMTGVQLSDTKLIPNFYVRSEIKAWQQQKQLRA